MADDFWIPRLTVRRVLDGDTIEAEDVDLGYHVHIRGVMFRILGVNAPEMKGSSRPAGQIAKEYTAAWLAVHAGHGVGLLVASIGSDNFGRWLGDVYCGLGDHLGEGLLASGNAVVYLPK